MRTFYEGWKDVFENRQIPSDNLGNHIEIKELEFRQMPSGEIKEDDMKAFLNVSFSNHHMILSKTKSLEERMFYIRRCATEFWSYLTTQYHINEKN